MCLQVTVCSAPCSCSVELHGAEVQLVEAREGGDGDVVEELAHAQGAHVVGGPGQLGQGLQTQWKQTTAEVHPGQGWTQRRRSDEPLGVQTIHELSHLCADFSIYAVLPLGLQDPVTL